MKSLLYLLAAALLLVGCAPKVEYLNDATLVPPGSRVAFWVRHDDHDWVESNIHIVNLPRTMSGAELRKWAEGTGMRDAQMRWTAYYVLVTLPGPGGKKLRSPVLPAHAGRF